jgi:tetratricopeptide (TPR) repeat protein
MTLLRDNPRLAALALCLVVIAVFGNSFANGFAGDSRGLALEDPRVKDGHIEEIFSHTYWWPYGESGLYRPFTTLTYLFNNLVLGGGAAGYHAVNLLLHGANVLLVLLLARRLMSKAGLERPAAGRIACAAAAVLMAALWAVHPVVTESVTNIAGRPDLLAGTCLLSGFYLYLENRLVALGAVTLIGAFSKENALALIGIVVLYELCFGSVRKLLWPLVAMLIPIQLYLYCRAAALYAVPPVEFPFWDNPITAAGFVAGRLTALEVAGRYLALLVWPARLSYDYSWAQMKAEPGVLGWLVLVLLPAAIWFAWRRSRMAFFLLCSALLVWLPSSNLLFPVGTIMAERFLYLPAIAFAAGVVALASRVRRFAPAIVGVIVVALAARTVVRNSDWKSDLALGEATVATAPESYKSHKLLAMALFDSHAPLDRVLAEADKSLAVLAPLPPLHNNADTWLRAARWYLEKKDPAAARRALEILQRSMAIVTAQEEHARVQPRYDPATAPYGTARADINRMTAAAYVQLGDRSLALESAARAVELDPGNADLWRQYAVALSQAGRNPDATLALMEGVMLTMDAGLRQGVVEMYRHLPDQGGCALLPGQGGNPALNPNCEIVHQDLCRATAAAIRLRLQGGRRDLADQLHATGVSNFGCAAAELDVARK